LVNQVEKNLEPVASGTSEALHLWSIWAPIRSLMLQ
jgi:hypothetical protein